MEYLIKVSAILFLFYVCYKLFLNRETFFESNRLFLLIGVASAFVLPLITIPKYIEVEPIIRDSSFAFTSDVSQSMNIDNSLSIITIILFVYLAGVIFFLSKFLFQFSSLLNLLINSTKQRVESFIYVITNKALSPFSFFNWIVYNPTHFNKTELEQIITHEKIHAKQLHSIDILLVEFASIALWFNPLVWLYKKDLRQNLEFIADKNAQATTDCKKSYQHLLLKTSVPNYQMALTNNFYNSLIKKRIVMLHKNRSSKKSQLKFLLILPALALFLMSFNTKEVYIEKESSTIERSDSVLDLNMFSSDEVVYDSESKKSKVTAKTNTIAENIENKQSIKKQDIVAYFIESNFTDDQLDDVVSKIKKQGVTLKIKNVKRNNDNEIIALKIDAKSSKSNANFSIDNDSPIKPIKITYNAKENSISIGNANSFIHDKDYEYRHKDGVVTIKKSGKGNNVFVYSADDMHDGDHEVIEDGDKIIIKSGSKVHELKKANKDKNVFVISNEGKTIDLKGDGKSKTITEWKDKDGNIIIHAEAHGENGFFITKDGDKEVKVKVSGNTLWTDEKDGKVIIKSSGGKSLWVDKDEEDTISVQSIGKGKDKFFISTKEGEQPLYIVDGKEVTKKDLDLDPNNIESVNVLKGESATKKYGKKGKDGVVEIITKKKKD